MKLINLLIFAIACLSFESVAFAQNTVQSSVNKIIVNMQDGGSMACDQVNGSLVNCVPIQMAPVGGYQNPQTPVAQPMVVSPNVQPQVIYVNAQQPESTTFTIEPGHVFFTGGLSYYHMLWEYLSSYSNGLYDDNMGNGFQVDLTLGYEWKHFGLFTSLDVGGAWACDNSTDAFHSVFKDSEDTTYSLFNLGWFSGPMAHYLYNNSINVFLTFGLGLEHMKFRYTEKKREYDFNTMSEVTKKTSGTSISETFFSLKLGLGVDFFLTQTFSMGLAFNYIFVDMGDSDEFEDTDPAHMLGFVLNFTYTNY